MHIHVIKYFDIITFIYIYIQIHNILFDDLLYNIFVVLIIQTYWQYFTQFCILGTFIMLVNEENLHSI